jgi:SHS2 domain-containing protein
VSLGEKMEAASFGELVAHGDAERVLLRRSSELVVHVDTVRVLRKTACVVEEKEEGCGVRAEMRHASAVASCREAEVVAGTMMMMEAAATPATSMSCLGGDC